MARDTLYPESVKAGKPILSFLPDGWEQKTLDNYLNLESRKAKLVNDQEFDLVTVKRSRGGVVRREHLLGRNISVKTQFYIKEGDFLISKRQIVHGACGVVPKALDGSIVSNEYCVFTGKDNFHLPFLEYLSETLYFQQVCFHSSIGVHIEKMIFKLETWFKWPFNIPPLAEQKKITQILSTWDQAISTTEQLLANSQQQKKALMQQLLTGKKRLLGENGVRFSGEWSIKSLNGISKVSIGLVTTMTDHYVEIGIPLIRNSDIKENRITKEKLIKLTKEFADQNSGRKLLNGDVVTVHTGEVGVSAVIDDELNGCLGFATLNTRPNTKVIDAQFLCWYFNSSRFIAHCVSLSTGDGRQNLNLKDFSKVMIPVPSLEEQKKLAAVLSTADQEIEVLQQKLECLKQEKKALMQQLLTGKRRVKVED